MDHGREACIGLVATHGHSLELLQFTEEVLDEVPPFIDVQVDVEWFFALGPLRNHDLRPAFVQRSDNPVGVERLVGDQAAKFRAFNKRGQANRVIPLARHQHETDEIAQRVGKSQDFGRQAASRLANGLIFGPPFAPWPCR